jgi:hypothetical protein
VFLGGNVLGHSIRELAVYRTVLAEIRLLGRGVYFAHMFPGVEMPGIVFLIREDDSARFALELRYGFGLGIDLLLMGFAQCMVSK